MPHPNLRPPATPKEKDEDDWRKQLDECAAEAHNRTKEINAKYADSLYKRKATSSAPTAKPKTTPCSSGNRQLPIVPLPAPKRKRLETA